VLRDLLAGDVDPIAHRVEEDHHDEHRHS
jgi:hypothetical protein